VPTSPLHVEALGRRDAPTLVLVHGFGASNHSWRKWVPDLTRDHRVLLVELMGFGRSATPPGGDYSPLAQAGHLVELLRHLTGPVPPVLVGHSLGGAVILLAALRIQDEGGRIPVRGLVVVSGAVFPQRFPPFIGLARRAGAGELLLALQPPAWAIRAGLRGIVHDPDTVDDEQVEGYRAPLASRERRRAILRAARQILPAQGKDLSDRYREITPPVLALWGARDRVVSPSFARRLAETVETGRAVLLPEVGHLPPEEAPEASLAEVRRFLAEVGAGPGRHVGGSAPHPLPAQGPEHPHPHADRHPE
jgi:pimeloyl-ACP methyl ester carboxylesterase